MTVEEKDRSLGKTLGRNLKYLREQKGMTQEQLAESFEVSQSTIAAWENGKREPGLYHLFRIQIFFDADLNKMICGSYMPPLVIRNLVYLQEKYGVSNQEIGLMQMSI